MSDIITFYRKIDVVVDNLDPFADFKYKYIDPLADSMEKGILENLENLDNNNNPIYSETKKSSDSDNKIKNIIRKILIVINK